MSVSIGLPDNWSDSRPKYIIGYGSCLMRLCAHVECTELDVRNIGVQCVINTSEPLGPDDAVRLAKVFGSTVVNEYGMAEAGVIGYSVGDLFPIHVFWRDFIVYLQSNRLIVTTIGERCFPLINYDTEDLSLDTSRHGTSLLHISSLIGKVRDVVEVSDEHGNAHQVSVVLFDHILKQLPQVRSLHYEVRDDQSVNIKYTCVGRAPSDEEFYRHLTRGMRRAHIDIDPRRILFQKIRQPLQTIAGKRTTLVRH